MKHLQQVSTFSGRDKHLYPAHYRQAFAFCCFLSRLRYQFSSRSSYLFRGTHTGYQVPYSGYCGCVRSHL